MNFSKESVWQRYSRPTNFEPLEENIEVDVAIIGGGICGITTAQLLAAEGLKVAVLEALTIGESNTGHSTGNLYSTLGKELAQLHSRFKLSEVEQVVRSRREAVDFIEQNVQRFNIDCEFKRIPWYYYSAVAEGDKYVEKELKVGKELGLMQDYVELPPSALKSRKAVMVERQAQCNPLTYVQDLARSIVSERCLIFEHTKVEEIDTSKDKSVLTTSRGTVTARNVIHATHTPKGIVFHHTLLGPYREYGIACKVENLDHPPGIFFGYYNASHLTSTRTYEKDGEQFLIVVGEPHKVGQGDSAYHIGELEKFARNHFNVKEVTHRWGGQHYKSTDLLPYIGRKGANSHVYMASGFSTHGLVYGTVAAKVICDLIVRNQSEYAELYNPLRLNPVKSAPKFIKENVNVFYEYVKDYLLKHDRSAFEEVEAGEGKVLEHGGHKLAVYRDEEEHLQVCSAVCTHLGCVVHWNNAERSWDCPCHGSRFDTSGEVLEGPALKALEQVELPKEKERPLPQQRPDTDRNVTL